MNEFKKELRVNQEFYNKDYILRKLNNIIEKEMENTNSKKFSLKEKVEQQTVLFRIYKIINSYDELEPILTKFFNEKAKEEKWKSR